MVSLLYFIFGGFVSGGLTYTSMKEVGSRLKNTMYDSLNDSTEELQKDLEEIKKEMPDVIDVAFEKV
ncbi:hypothetical protein [Ectobacillus ponti]|uniref:YtxH domain-containing protein n=1 Tax=Ectobacillus ponti TaxID=2961894 RepID=A0AA42BR65_9BACI|nr:hypothetical protein [Ectobacillus ponti]MCP8970091.1 hypothetical protein [Ectobacillus ponti]